MSRTILAEPIEIAKFWKNRRRDTAIVVSLGSYEGHNLVSIREHFIGKDGIMRPTKRGLSLVVHRLPRLAAATAKALARAQELALIAADDHAGDGASDGGEARE